MRCTYWVGSCECNGDLTTVKLSDRGLSVKDAAEQVLLLMFVLGTDIVLPAAIIYGWVRWAKSKARMTGISVLSLVAFALATSSALLALGSLLYAHLLRSFPFHDPTLMQIYRWGFLSSLSGFILGIVGCWRRSALRWYAPICSLGVVVFWIAAAWGE